MPDDLNTTDPRLRAFQKRVHTFEGIVEDALRSRQQAWVVRQEVDGPLFGHRRDRRLLAAVVGVSVGRVGRVGGRCVGSGRVGTWRFGAGGWPATRVVGFCRVGVGRVGALAVAGVSTFAWRRDRSLHRRRAGEGKQRSPACQAKPEPAEQSQDQHGQGEDPDHRSSRKPARHPDPATRNFPTFHGDGEERNPPVGDLTAEGNTGSSAQAGGQVAKLDFRQGLPGHRSAFVPDRKFYPGAPLILRNGRYVEIPFRSTLQRQNLNVASVVDLHFHVCAVCHVFTQYKAGSRGRASRVRCSSAALWLSYAVMQDRFRVAFVCGKLGDVDGVSLEVDKWIAALQGQGHEIFTVAGRYANPLPAVPEENQRLMQRIRFDSPEQRFFETAVFPHLNRRPPHQSREKINLVLEQIEAEGTDIANHIHEFVQEHEIDVLVAENTNAMPMTLIGGMAMYRLATEQRMATIFHHHDFWWERSRFSNSHIDSLLTRIMPPADLGLEHTVISSYSAHILSSLKRVQPHVVPNCEDFDNPVWKDSYNGDFREALGFREDDILVVQPTRIVPRKRIEDSLSFVSRLRERYPEYRGRLHYIISLYQGDEPDQNYIDVIRSRAAEADIPLHLISDRVASVRGEDAQGRKLYTNRDVLAHADLVTYLPIWEGFGNALLESIAAKVPVVTTTYLVYKTDILPTQLTNVEIRDAYDETGRLIIPDRAVDEAVHLLRHPEERQARVDHNFEIARQEFGLDTLSRKLQRVFTEYGDEIRAYRKRRVKAGARYSV